MAAVARVQLLGNVYFVQLYSYTRVTPELHNETALTMRLV